ncbi:MAG: ornithine carbamoyltransferase [Actinobacteria bacterium]|nr:ornithine carbamoyltransferase [Actinomycetota bacterium]MDA2961811.1 ornithine carbamoyltransferase [Actinomycetota bacterium]MDA2995447.1 ornithine carbamoyltransferase [Actinomycetota bacterium]
MTTRHLLNIIDLSIDELSLVGDLSDRVLNDLHRPLAGGGVALIFEKPSNRTRQSMEMAVVQLGGHPVYTRGEEVGLDTRESVEDVIQILEGYHSMVAARVFSHGVVERMAALSSIPIVNMLSDWSHPLQALADLRTMRHEFGSLSGRQVAWVGDYNNVARSLGEACVMSGMSIRFACPGGFEPSVAECERLAKLGSGEVISTDDPVEAATHADAVHTDTWVSMGQEDEVEERRRIFAPYSVTDELMAVASSDAIFMHCLPAYRGYEVAASVIDGPASRVVRQGHDRLHAARGALAFLGGVR